MVIAVDSISFQLPITQLPISATGSRRVTGDEVEGAGALGGVGEAEAGQAAGGEAGVQVEEARLAAVAVLAFLVVLAVAFAVEGVAAGRRVVAARRLSSNESEFFRQIKIVPVNLRV